MIGSIDVLFDFMKMFKEGYIGVSSYEIAEMNIHPSNAIPFPPTADMLWPITEKYGPIFNIRVFWQHELFTIEPEHIKVSSRIQPFLETPMANWNL